jgi:hypothetical protein
MNKHIHRLVPEPANQKISIDLSIFYEFGEHISKVQEKYQHKSRPDLDGVYIKGNAYGAIPSNCKQNQEGRSGAALVNNLNKIAEFSNSKGLSVFLIEISICDARDDEGNRFHTYIYSSSSKMTDLYVREIQNNIKLERDKSSARGLILPASSFYTYPYLAAQVHGKFSQKTIDRNIFEPLIFVGNVSLSKVSRSDEPKKIKKATTKFIRAVLKKHLCDRARLKHVSDEDDLLLGVAIPIIRPVKLSQREQERENDLKDPCRYNGGGIFIYGIPTDEFNLAEFVLRMKTDLLEKSSIKESFAARDHYRNGRNTAANDFSHEMKHVLGALQGGWLRETSDIFEIVHSPQHDSAENQYIGRIEVYEQELFDGIRIAPIPDFVNNIGRLGFLWTGSYNIQDLPFKLNGDNNQVELSELIDKTWNFMVEIAVTSLIFKAEPNEIHQIKRLKSNYKSLISIFPEIQIEGEDLFSKPPVVKLGERSEIAKLSYDRVIPSFDDLL